MSFALQLLTSDVYSQNNLAWANPAGSTGGDEGIATTVDALGNVYTTGFFNGTNTDFDPGPGTAFLTAPVTSNIFVTKFDAAGNLIWARRLGGNVSSHGLSIAVDASGNVLTTGYFFGTADFNPGAGVLNLTSAGGEDIFVSKLDPSGNFVWAKRMGGTGQDYGRSIAVASSGDVLITGFFNGTVDFDPDAGTFPFTSAGSQDIFISKLAAATGALVWAKQMGGISADAAFSLAVDGTGNVLTTGYFNGSVDFDPDPGPGIFTLTSFSASYDIFVSKLDAAGNFVWAQQMGGTATEIGTSITVDPTGNVYTTGHFTFGTGSPIDMDPGAAVVPLTPVAGQSASSNDIFISKLNSSGNFVWAKQLGGTGTDESWSIALDASENVYTTGLFEGVADFDPGTPTVNLTSNGSSDIFVSKLTNFGDFAWAEQIGGAFADSGAGIDVDASGNVLTTGDFTGTVDFAPGACTINLTSVANADIFLIKLSQSLIPPPTISGFSPPSGPAGTIVTIDGTNFDPIPSNNIVRFNGLAATVTASTAISITAVVPTGALDGTLSVTIVCNTATSAASFDVTGPCFIPVHERDALEDLYNATGGATWTSSTNWLNADESTWYGITVAGCRVVEIDLAGNNLDGPLNSSITNLTSLQRLKLNGNAVTGTLPTSIDNMTSLIEISMQSNMMGGIIPASLENCTALEDLNLENNSFGGDVPVFLGAMSNLRSINLGFNFFVSTIPPELGNLTNLTSLSLAENLLFGSIPPELGNLGSLDQLDLSRNQLTGQIPPELGNLNVQLLQLGSNLLDGPIPPELGNIFLLRTLDLSDNQLNGTVPPELGNLSNLLGLSLERNQLSGSLPAAIGGIDLEVVYLNNNFFTSLPIFDDEFIIQLSTENNNLDFADLEPNITCDGFSYTPQARLPPGGTINFTPGGAINIPFTTPGTANLYQWFKDGSALAGFTSATLTIPTATFADAGTYYIEVTSSLVPGLTLQSRPYLVISDPCLLATRIAGDLDISFDPLIDNPTFVSAIGVQSDGRIVASTGPTDIDGSSVDGIVRFEADGTLDGSFISNGIRSDHMIVQPDDKILTTYRFGTFDSFRGLTRLDADGSDDSGFNSISTEFIYAIGLQPDGKILISYHEEASPDFLARLESDGNLDFSFTAPEDLTANVIKVQSNDFILIGGQFPGGIVRLDPTGAIDPTFSPDVSSPVIDMVIQPDGKIIIVGGFEYVNNVPHRGIARLNPDGSLDPTFIAMGITDPSESGFYFNKGVRQSDGKLVVAGVFDNINGSPRKNLVRLNEDGTMDCAFDPVESTDTEITGLALQPDEQVVIAGSFISYDGSTRNGLARVNNAAPGPPTITNYSPVSGNVGTTITVTGTNFSPTPGNNLVYFGATQAVVTAASSTEFTTSVPPGATFEPITATVGGLTAWSPTPFIPTFSGGNPIATNSFAAKVDFAAPAPAFGINVGDLDNDGLADMVVSSQSGTTGIFSVYRNTSTPGTITTGSFTAPVDFTKANSVREGMAIADIDGDGKPEIVAVDIINNRVSIYRNISTPGTLDASSFDTPVEFNVGFFDLPTNVDVEDLDADGRPEIVTADFGGDRITIIRNISTPGSIAFEPRIYIPAGDGATDIAIRDFNKDGKPDLAIANELANTVSVLENVSVPGTIEVASFSPAVHFAVGNSPNKIAIGDIDGDGNQDIVTANLGASTISILRNVISVGPINSGSFSPAVSFVTSGINRSVELGDLNGDGIIDVVTAVDTGGPGVSVLQNTSTPGTLQFNPFVGFASGVGPFELAIGDFDSDGRSDIATANNGGISASVLRFNSSPATITITQQPADAIVCEGTVATFTTAATGTTNITFQWQFSPDGIVPFSDIANSSGYSNVTTPTLSVNTTGSFGEGRYRCRINGDLALEEITFDEGLFINPVPPAPTTSGASSCAASSLTLMAGGSVNGNYRWYTVASGGIPIAGEVNDTYITPVFSVSTTYHVAVNDGTCESARTPVAATIDIVSKPTLVTSNCTATSAILTGPSGFPTYAWSTGEATQQITVNTAGSYTLTVTSSTGCVSPVSDPVVFTSAFCNQPPVIQPTSVTATIQGTVTVDITSITSDLDNNLDLSTLQVIVQPSSGATATINTSFELVVDYSNVNFVGTDQLTVQVCDVVGACAQEIITIEVAGDITVFNALSPNGDGKNEVLYIEFIDALPDTKDNKLTILNRWGSVVFEAVNYNNTTNVFKGLNNSGAELPSGTYYYMLEFTSGAPKRTGFISLRR